MIGSQKEKESSMYDAILQYQAEGHNKSAAVRRVQQDFGYISESAVWGVFKREAKRRKEAENDNRPS